MSDANPNERAGGCMCGAVRYTARGLRAEVSACHCDMCRRWSSGPFFAVSCDELDFAGGDAPATLQSSAWAERGFCSKCGSGLFYRVTAEGPHHGVTTVALGTLDDQSGLTLVREWYIDKRPEVYELAGDRKKVTEAEVVAMFGGG